MWFSSLMAVALTIFSGGVLALHARWGQSQFDSELTSLAVETSRVLQEELAESGKLQKAAAEVQTSVNVPDRAIAVLDGSGAPVAADWHGFEYDVQATASGVSSTSLVTVSQHGRAWRVLTQHGSSSAGDYTILVGGRLDKLDRQQGLLERVLLVATPLAVLLTGAVCWWVASAALRPVTTMAAQAEAITARSADWRLDGVSKTDELGQLASAFNRLLVRLASASELQRQFMADASHELRTPVSVIQTTTEVTLDRENREQPEYREALTIINEQSTRLQRVVEDMLVLTRADAGGLRLNRRPLYLDEAVKQCVQAISMVAATREIAVRTKLQPEISINGDDHLLRQLTTNLLSNALQYTPRGGSVVVSVASDATGAFATVTVSDAGPGIPAADRERVFERFVRLDSARSTTSGAGLGLPIARWIAEAHAGTLTVEENAGGGCRFVLRLPLKHVRSALT
jgi:two-component system, OmpR family, sensor kinase